MEEWRDIANYEGLYQVSNTGKVRSIRRVKALNYAIKMKELKATSDKNGYLIVGLCKDSKHKYLKVHRLVALAFIPNPDNLPSVNHKDEIKSNNSVDNLEWCTAKYNSNYGTARNRISKAQKNIPRPTSQREKNYFYGKHFTYGESPHAKKVIQLTKDGQVIMVFDCIKSAAEHIGVTGSAISMCCKGERKSCKGFLWKYA